ncbi:TAM domain methyltransferase [Colletotrichum nymphaeae SA-01]|uniref:TAM domain methyltransferase n=1 Tax=Colletotrichum nymphaeae SA-01 TaxID=1460502 RepID=A0A135SKZ0_9PEZI|nr:TAM domain methyltransferase [Colletotrichum nymphaeae SA-01]
MAEIDREVKIVAEETDNLSNLTSQFENVALSTHSLTASIFQNRVENGRTYHRYKDGKYNMPNDETESERLDFQHDICIYTFDDKLGIAPPCDDDVKVGRVLDVGTGTGSWAMDFGDLHPESDVSRSIAVSLTAVNRRRLSLSVGAGRRPLACESRIVCPTFSP